MMHPPQTVLPFNPAADFLEVTFTLRIPELYTTTTTTAPRDCIGSHERSSHNSQHNYFCG